MAKVKEDPNKGCLKLLESIEETLQCTICMVKLENPHICIHCSQIFCLKCIEKWLKKCTSNGKCPHCKKIIIGKLVKIRWLDEVLKVGEFRTILEKHEAAFIEKEPDIGLCNIQSTNHLCTSCSEIICIECCEQEYDSVQATLNKRIRDLEEINAKFNDSINRIDTRITFLSTEYNENIKNLKLEKTIRKKIEHQNYLTKLELINADYDKKLSCATYHKTRLINFLNNQKSRMLNFVAELQKIQREIKTYGLQSRNNVIRGVKQFEFEQSFRLNHLQFLKSDLSNDLLLTL